MRTDPIALSGVGFRYAFWRLAEEIASRDPDAPDEVKAKIAEAIPFYRPHVPDDEIPQIEVMASMWREWPADRLFDLSEEWSGRIDEMDDKYR